MISKTLKLSLCIVAVFAMSVVNAQERKGKKRGNPEQLFKTLDADTNGELSLEEFTSKRQHEDIKAEVMSERFKTLDSDANGTVYMEEFKSLKEIVKEEHIQKRFAKMDGNGDGTIDISEYKAFIEDTKTHRKKRKHRRHKKQD